MRAHTHECQQCRTRFECSGAQEHNYDGYPEVWCRDYHDAGWDKCPDCEMENEALREDEDE